MKPLCIYHGNCADGFTAAWVVRKALSAACDFHAGVYQNPPPDVDGRDVFIVDFSYKRPVLEDMAKRARSITVLDHHKTAAEDLRGLPGVADWHTLGGMPMPGLGVLFDMNRSGAGIAWDYFMTSKRPALLNHIEDRDLWKFALRRTREIQSSVFSYPYEFAVWDFLMEADLEALGEQGEAIERKHFKDIRELIGVVTRPMKVRAPWLDGPAPADLGFVEVPFANLPYTLTSDAGHILAKGKGTDAAPEFPFAGCYWDTPDGRVFSLRSAAGGADVGEIAKQYGGGGHKHASGFRVPFGHDLAR
jgi:hypothetical protein